MPPGRPTRLTGYVTAVGVLGAICAGRAVADLSGGSTGDIAGWFIAAYAAIAVLAAFTTLRVRLGAERLAFKWTDAVVVIGLATLPGGWVILIPAVATLAADGYRRLGVLRVVLNSAKNAVAASAALGALSAFGVRYDEPLDTRKIFALLVAAGVFLVVNDAIAAGAIALSSGRGYLGVVFAGGSLRLLSTGGNLGLAFAAILVIEHDHTLLVALPPLALALDLAYRNWQRAGEERTTWERLAKLTHLFTDVDLDGVLTSAVTGVAQLFSADEVDLIVRLDGQPTRLLRGTAAAVDYDGPAAQAPVRDGTVVTEQLADRTHTADLGELTLRFHGKVALTDREHTVLRTLTAALGTAIRNAHAFTETHRLAADSAHEAAHDPLTGLANRRGLLAYAARSLAEPARGVTALLLIDLDHFKEVNDTLGHAAGDELLTQVGRRLACAAGPDDMVARLGGDEFAVLFAGLSAPALASHRSRQMLATLAAPVRVDGMPITVEASGGVAIGPPSGGVTELLRRADVAMYQAKRQGHTVAMYSRNRDTADPGRLALGGELRRALAEGEFAVTFQPVVDLVSGRITAAEALARWHHPDRGDLDPRRFLTSVERSGMLPTFTASILDASLRAARRWYDAGYEVPVSVNVSPRNLLDRGYPELVQRSLAAAGLPTSGLLLELTETLTGAHLDTVDWVLAELRQAGVRLALDDFGTGSAPLTSLARVPVNQLKIDRSLVCEMDSSAEAAAVVHSAVELGRSLDLDVVAVGVESRQQRLLLLDLGCPAGQGHLFARPLSAERLLTVLDGGGQLAEPVGDPAEVIRMPIGRAPRRARR